MKIRLDAFFDHHDLSIGCFWYIDNNLILSKLHGSYDWPWLVLCVSPIPTLTIRLKIRLRRPKYIRDRAKEWE